MPRAPRTARPSHRQRDTDWARAPPGPWGEEVMTIVIAAGLLAVGLVVAALLFRRSGPPAAPAPGPAERPAPLDRDAVDAELRERRAEIARIEERSVSKEHAL